MTPAIRQSGGEGIKTQGAETGTNLAEGPVSPRTRLAMNSKRFVAILLLLLALGDGRGSVASRAAPGRQVVTGDLNHDGRIERVVLDPSQDPALSVWHGRHRLWQGVPRRWQPWKLRIADVDGDGLREIVVGVRKATHFFPHPHNCLFLYAFDGRTVKPKWLGSSLSQPFTDFAFADLGGRGEKLVAVE